MKFKIEMMMALGRMPDTADENLCVWIPGGEDAFSHRVELSSWPEIRIYGDDADEDERYHALVEVAVVNDIDLIEVPDV